jgi:hypothetical protein
MRNEFSVEFAVTGAFFVLAGAYQLWRGFGTSAWRGVQGAITETFVFETEEETVDDDRPNDPRWQSFYVPRVMYKYSVRGKEYEGDTLQRGIPRLPLRFVAQKRVGSYRNGQRVMVYHSPTDPSQAVLKRGPAIDGWLMLAGGVALLVLAAVLR